MSRFLLIAVYGSTIAIALAFTFAEYGNEGKTTVWKKYMDDFEPEFEDALRYLAFYQQKFEKCTGKNKSPPRRI